MAYKDLRDFVRVLEQRSLIRRIQVEVDPELEITEITDRISKEGGPALLFEKVKGSPYPLLINAFGSMERICLALEVGSLEEIARRILDIIEPEIPTNLIEKIKQLPKLKRLANFIPKKVKTGPVKEVIEKDRPSLSSFPILKCWPLDGGRFITLPLVFTKNPVTGTQNCGMYRMHVYDDRTTGMHWHIHKHGSRHYQDSGRRHERLPVAVALGADPAVIYSATAPLPDEFDEMLFAGFLRGEPVEMVSCETVDLVVPAHAEIILEGYVDPGESRVEGPFGDHTGYYSLSEPYPVFHITCITRRKNPLYPTTIVGKPPMEDCYLGKATERIFLPLLRKQLPEVVDMNLPLEGIFHNMVFISIDKRYPGHARKVMHSIWGTGQMMFTKMIVVVDAHVNVQNTSEVLWRLGNNVDWKRDVEVVEGPLDALDHASPLPKYGAKIGIDATKKWPTEGHTREWPEDIVMIEEIRNLVTSRWKAYGF
ncbi:MAG: menaquinone biosynthesis decarboxylase [bacterium]|mgnify:CR=1 FL=1